MSLEAFLFYYLIRVTAVDWKAGPGLQAQHGESLVFLSSGRLVEVHKVVTNVGDDTITLVEGPL